MNNGVNRPSSFEEEVVYKECLHNMAASLGKDSFDGCREFMKTGEDGTMEAMKCAACGCHRNFHRKDIHYNRAPVHQNQNSRRVVLVLPAFNQTAARIRSRSKDENAEMASPVKKKRAAFTQEQKNQMVAFAERYDWKVYRRADKEEVERFCMEIGIHPYNFKVWLGNQRRFSKGKNTTTTNDVAAAASATAADV